MTDKNDKIYDPDLLASWNEDFAENEKLRKFLEEKIAQKRKESKRVAFDIGNVLCHIDLEGFYDFLVKDNIMTDRQQAEDFIASIQHPQDLGLYNIRQGFYRFNPQLHEQNRSKIQGLYYAWLDIVEPSEEMLGVIDDALRAGYEVALLSNIGFDHSSLVRQKCKVFKHCHQHFSCEVGARKPTQLFYQSFMLQYGWKIGSIFLDDRKENIEAAKPYFNGMVFDLDDYKNDKDAANVVRDMLRL